MIQKLANRIRKKFFQGQFKDEIEEAKFEYGLLLFIETLLDILGFIVIGLLLGCLDHLAVYLLTFAVVRLNAGGYHAKTFIGCFATITVMALTSVGILTYYNGPLFVYLTLGVLSGGMIMIMAPLDSISKPLSERQKRRCKVKTLYFTTGIMALSFVLYVLGYLDGFKMMTLALMGQMLSMIPIFYKYKKGEKYYENVI
ncbi:accessory gene regulator ArgB-like protein [Fusibacter ferrireducens]|uniref:Accessory gene regulator B family protein n=1 Tax=Fusibacter ferrireducens TaxID=2785058 RepID=A0ABR9ZX14_9FIRM|nr:accessory gene regulator B family protein [Fusibacter ferrireducens]MBF4694991.1 accessory gene regulator B family protein [Fusibacter ferrireducens]